jgi:hypothetical protein
MLSSLWLKFVIPLALVALIVMGGCQMMKLSGCNSKPPKPLRTVTEGPFDVIRAESGKSLVVEGGTKRRPSERQVTLANIEIPQGVAEKAKANLEKLAAGSVTVTIEKHGIFRSDAPDSLRRQDDGPREAAETPEAVESRGPLEGVVSAAGVNLNLAQVAAGFAQCTPDAPDDWKAAQYRVEHGGKERPSTWSPWIYAAGAIMALMFTGGILGLIFGKWRTQSKG